MIQILSTIFSVIGSNSIDKKSKNYNIKAIRIIFNFYLIVTTVNLSE